MQNLRVSSVLFLILTLYSESFFFLELSTQKSASANADTNFSELLFEKGWVKFQKHGRRLERHHVTRIDALIAGNHTYVMVRARHIRALHRDAVGDLSFLRDLTLKKNKMEVIAPGAFGSGLPNLTTIQLQDNRLTKIEEGIFSGLPIRFLSLQRNYIRKIESGAFDDMPSLFRIKLNNNRLKTWDADWFKNTPNLSELYFRRNRLHTLPDSAFRNLQTNSSSSSLLIGGKTGTKIYLSKNKLGKLSPGAFLDLQKISQLWLDRNGITEVPGRAFENLREIDVLYLARNRIQAVRDDAIPNVRIIGILDLSANSLECLPFGIVSRTNMTNLERNNVTCTCMEDLKTRLNDGNISTHVSYDANCVT